MARGKANTRCLRRETGRHVKEVSSSSNSDSDFVPSHIEYDERSHSMEELSDIPLSSTEHVDKRKRKHIKKNQCESKQHQKVSSKAENKGCGSGWRKAAIDTRCSPNRLNRLCNSLTKQQIEIVKAMGFGAIFHIKAPLDRKLCFELVNALDLSRMCIFVKGQPIGISYEDVGIVFDLPVLGLKIPTSITKEQESLLEDFLGINDTRLIGMIKQGTTDQLFKRAFILYVLSGFFCPTSNLRPSPRLMGAIVDVENVLQYNWSQFIFEWLVDHITMYRTSQYKSRNIGGCLFFLMIVYFHRHPLANMGSASVPPLVAYWDDRRVRRRIRHERKTIKGILYRMKDRSKLFDPQWLNSTYKSEIVRHWVVQHLQMFKKLDDAVLAGKYNSSLVPNLLPSFKIDESCMGNDEDNEKKADGCMASDEEIENEQTLDGRVMEACSKSVTNFEAGSARNTSRMKRETMIQKLYAYCTKDPRGKPDMDKEGLININGHFLDRGDIATMRPRYWIMNTVVSFASMMLNDVEKTQRRRSRHCLPSWFMDRVTLGLQEFKSGQHKPWESIPKECHFLSHEVDMGKCNLIFAPVVMDDHWWCYAMDKHNNNLFVLDSMTNSHDGDKLLVDNLAAIRFEELLVLSDRTLTRDQVKLKLVRVELPQQDGSNDCGIYTIKYMEMWDGVTTYDGGLTMPVWTRSDIATFRRDLLLQWVLDDRNAHRAQVLKAAKVDDLLPSCVYECHATPLIATRSIDVHYKQSNDADTIEDDQGHWVKATDKPPSSSTDQLKTYERKRRDATGSHVDSDHEVDAMDRPPSTIAERAKKLPRKRMAGPHNRTPYTERHVKQTRKR